jgi:hypothetical protein
MNAKREALLRMLDAISVDTPRAVIVALIIEAERFLEAKAAARTDAPVAVKTKESRRVH